MRGFDHVKCPHVLIHYNHYRVGLAVVDWVRLT